ncbi:unnamed protein product, partial [Mesorhabditis belari]|uniref:Large ribosomal subunit protein uL4m n=1 Tax=Mesorhabditis belari TaxID=2138241 RepID=A0AAF3FQ38_9BILA
MFVSRLGRGVWVNRVIGTRGVSTKETTRKGRRDVDASVPEAQTTSEDGTFEIQESSSSPSIEDRPLWRLPKSPFVEIPQAWVTSFNSIKEQKLGLVDLHPDVFRVSPRLDILHRNITWQENYRNLQLTKMLSKGEMPGGGAKPWPQKRTGRHHAGSIRAPHFSRGGFAHGARGPRTWFYMLPDSLRIQGLCVALTVKHAQDDLQIVDRLDELADGDPQYLMDLAEERNWGYSVLFVNDTDTITGGLAEATSQLPSMTVMPFYGLNCFSILKYDTVVFSQKALELVESRLLQHKHRADTLQKKYCYKDMKETLLREGEKEEHPQQAPFV